MTKHGHKRELKEKETDDLNLDVYSTKLHSIAITQVTNKFIKEYLFEKIKECKLAKDVKFKEYTGKISAVCVELSDGGRMVLKEKQYEPEVYLQKEVFFFMNFFQR